MVTAVSSADTTKTASASVTISVSIAISPVSASVLLGQTQAFTATVVGIPNSAVDWSLTCSGICDPTAIGSIDSSGVYTAPNVIPDSSSVSVVATLQADSTQTASAGVNINAGGSSVNQGTQSGAIALGTSGGNGQDSTSSFCCSGTLGSLVVRNGIDFILSNNHVLARSDQGKAGENIVQPGLVDTNCSPAQKVATLTQFITLEGPKLPDGNFSAPADAAISQIVNGAVDTTGAILQLGAVSGGLAQPAPPANTTLPPALGMTLAKSGRTTGLTCHVPSPNDALGVEVQVDYETACNGGTTFTVEYSNQILIDSTTFSAPGDSGSLIVDATTAQPVALLYAGDSSSTIGNPIQDALSNLQGSPAHTVSFVGGAQHTVEACTGNSSPGGPGGLSTHTSRKIADDEVQRVMEIKGRHMHDLMTTSGVIGVGVGAGDTPGKAAIIVLVQKGKEPGPIASKVEGVPTKVREVERFRAYSGPWACPVNPSVAKGSTR